MHALDRQTDRFSIARLHLHSMKRGKNVANIQDVLITKYYSLVLVSSRCLLDLEQSNGMKDSSPDVLTNLCQDHQHARRVVNFSDRQKVLRMTFNF